MMFREPVSPGAGLRKLLRNAFGSENRFGEVVPPPRVGEVCTGLVTVAQLRTFQFVGQPPTSTGELAGRPLLYLKIEVSCQPPINASTTLLVPLNQWRLRPT